MKKIQQQLRDTGLSKKNLRNWDNKCTVGDVLTLEWKLAIVLRWESGHAYVSIIIKKVWLPAKHIKIRSDQGKSLVSWDMNVFTKQIAQVIHSHRPSQLLIFKNMHVNQLQKGYPNCLITETGQHMGWTDDTKTEQHIVCTNNTLTQ